MLKADLHMHSNYSRDCSMPLEQIIQICQDRGINCVALTDHGQTEGALRLREIAPFKVIIGQEVLTPDGEIMGLFLKETVPAGLSPADAVARIKEQGGLAGVPHPFDRLRGLKRSALENLLPQLDFIEVLNARSLLKRDNVDARRAVAEHRFLAAAGSDAHPAGEIGRVYVEMDEFSDKQEFLTSLAKGKVTGHLSSPFVHFHTSIAKVTQKFRKK